VEDLIAIKNLKKKFGRNPVIKGIDLSINPGKITAILGPNGSGKTTIIKSILGMVIPDEGEILFEGKGIKRKWMYRERINYLPQIARFPENLKVRELIRLVKDLRKQDSEEVNLISFFDLEGEMEKAIRNLSGGTKQKLNLVLTFMFNNPLIILDEPSNGLDPVALLRLKDLIGAEVKNGKTVLFTTHIMSLVEDLAQEIIFILEGKVYFKGTQQELIELTGESNLERAIAKVLDHHGISGKVSPVEIEEK